MKMSDDAPIRHRSSSKRRANAEPYTRRPYRHPKQDTLQRLAPERSFFSRLISYIPLVGKMVANDNECEDNEEDQEIDTSAQSDDDETSIDNGSVDHNIVSSPQQHQTSNGTTASAQSSHERQLTSNKMTSTTSVSKELVSKEKQPIKTLKIADGIANTFAFRRSTIGRRRYNPIYNTETAMSVIKQRKAISLAEYERLSNQLRSLVDRTPVNTLALARVDQHRRGEEESPLKFTVHGDSSSPSSQKRWSSEQSVAALPSSKRARPSSSGDALHIINVNPRVDRSSRKPRPSRLLTGEKRDAASRIAYSAAVAEKVLSTLKKIETPLDQETFKPRPSTSLSWAQHHLALSRNQAQDVKMSEGAGDEEAPPIATVPTIAHAPSSSTKHMAEASSFAPTILMETPCAKQKVSMSSSPFFSTPSISMTPVVELRNEISMQDATKAKKKATTDGHYSFRLPPPSEMSMVNKFDEDTLKYYFSPPPALRDPPKHAPKLKMRCTDNGTTTPFAFMPASPKIPAPLTKSTPKPKSVTPPNATSSTSFNPLARFMQMEEGSWKCPSCCVVNKVSCNKCPCCEANKPSAHTVPVTFSSEVSTASNSNPLARFMNLPEGSWKCPTCSVTNEDKHPKCPCCETNKPGAASAGKATTASNTAGFHFGSAPQESKPSVTSSTVGSSSTFGASAALSTSAKPAAQPVFTFGATTASSITADPVTKPSFTFGVPVPSSTTSDPVTQPAFTFGASVSSNSPPPSSGATKSKGVESSGSLLNTTDAKTGVDNTLATKAAAQPVAGFTFGDVAVAPGVVQPTTGFTFGAPTISNGTQSTSIALLTAEKAVVSNTPSLSCAPRKQPLSDDTKVTPVSKKESTVALSFGTFGNPADSKAVLATECLTKSAAAFTFGKPLLEKPIDTTAVNTKEVESIVPVKKPSFVFGQANGSDGKTSVSTAPSVTSAFSFSGSATSSTQPNFSFDSSKASHSETAQPKPAFTFGKSSKASHSETAQPKPAFTFGKSSDATANSSHAFNVTATTTAAPAFTFGAPTTQPTSTQAPTGIVNNPPQQTSSFGNPPSSFGQTGKEFGSFRADAPAGFGASAPPKTPAFGSTASPSTTPAFSFGPQPQASTSTQSSFGFTQSSADGFSSTNAFGTPSTAVGGNPNSAFGANSTAFGIGAPSPFTPGAGSSSFSTNSTQSFGTPVVGSAPNFGSTFAASNSGFSAPTPSFGVTTPTVGGFGATPSNTSQFGASSAFGSSQDAGAGGFSVGQAPTKRRILKAKRKSNVSR